MLETFVKRCRNGGGYINRMELSGFPASFWAWNCVRGTIKYRYSYKYVVLQWISVLRYFDESYL